MTRVADRRQLEFVPGLDGLRGVAVLGVVTFHLLARFPKGLPDWWPRGGFLGVDAFFVLSGFLITALLLREQTTTGRLRFGTFYRRRALRLLPAVFALIAVQAIYAELIGVPGTLERSSVVSGLFYVSNWQMASGGGAAEGLGHLWSLAIEEQFYLLWPLIVLLVLGAGRRTATVVSVLATLIAAVALHRAVLFQHDVAWPALYFRTDTRADGLLIGALLAHLWVRKRTPTRGLRPAAWCALAFLLFCYFRAEGSSAFLYQGGFTAVALAVAAILLAVLESEWSATRVLGWGPLRATGRVSYGLYLWHPLVFFAVLWYGRHWNVAVQIAVAILVTVAATAASRVLVERPFLRLKESSKAPVPRSETGQRVRRTPGRVDERRGRQGGVAAHLIITKPK